MKKEYIVPFLVIGLSLAFAGVCIMVFLGKGKSAKWVARKMKIGAFLLTLTAVSCNKGDETEPLITCYVPVMPNSMWLETGSKSQLEINFDTSNVVKGGVYEVEGSQFSFAVVDVNDTKVQTGTIVALDGAFDSSEEDFEITLDNTLAANNYYIDLFATDVDGQDATQPQVRIDLMIKDE